MGITSTVAVESDLSIAEAKQKKFELELAIGRLVKEFYDQTGFTVASIDIEHITGVVNDGRRFVAHHVTVETMF